MKKENNEHKLASVTENVRRIIQGLPSGDPEKGTKWLDTLILIILLILLFFLFI